MIDPHISDQELTRFIDGELGSAARQAEISDHLRHCWTCRARRAELERTIADLVQAHRVNWDARIPAVDGPAALLKARMRSQQQERPATAWGMPQLAIATAAVVCLTLFVTTRGAGREGSPALPNAKLTPGAVRPVSREQVCSTGERGRVRVPANLAGQVFLEYGIDHPRPKAYEVDYLITPALGGADDIHNLWPQPYSGSPWTAPVKDALEGYLLAHVCEGTLDLATAQREIATNWIAAYRKYFHTSRPLAAHLATGTDDPWE